MAISLFGFTISRNEINDLGTKAQSFIAPQTDDGAATVSGAGYYGTYVDLDASSKSEAELITRYREAAMYADASTAIDEIVTEAIAAIDNEEAVSINLDDTNLPDNIKDTIKKEFNQILNLLNFSSKGYDIFRQWYVDGRIYYQKVIDVTNPKRGVIELRNIDPRKIRKMRKIEKVKDQKTGADLIKSVEEFFIYNEKGINYNPQYSMSTTTNQGLKLAADSIVFVSSGMMDLEKNVVLSYLHKAIKPINQLKMMEDALVIYRLSRAPERRISYIDVGNLPKIKAEQYLKDVMARYRNKIVYDSNTGEIRDDRKFMSMLEDFWLPRREGGRGTEITTLPGGENLGQIEDINYFQQKVYQSLNVPISRMQPQNGLQFGRAEEITRDELKFAKFVARLRKKFNEIFLDVLRTNLILRGVITDADWNIISEKIQIRYAQDQYFYEMKEAENLRNRIDILTTLQPFIGTFFSKQYVMKNILRMTDEDIERIQGEIQQEEPPNQPSNDTNNLGVNNG